jgi:hypothetical protein
MTQPFQEFLAARLPFPGLAAWSARTADRALTSQSYAPWLPSSRAEQILTRLALAADGLQYHQLEPFRLCWVFEHMRLHLALRHDGSCLALIVLNAHELSTTAVESVLEEFVAGDW